MPSVSRKEDIRAWRHKAWQPPIISRSHEIHDVFMKQGKDDELMLRGSVKYGKQDGSQGGAECGAWMVLAGGQAGLKIKSYTVWVVSKARVFGLADDVRLTWPLRRRLSRSRAVSHV